MLPLGEFWVILGLGIAIGVLGAMAGIGGGTLMVPFLTLAMGVPIHPAIAASVVAVIATSCAAAAVYLRSGLSNPRLGITLETATTIGGMTGGLIAVSTGSFALTLVFAAALLVTAIAMWRRPEEAAAHEESGDGQLGDRYFDPRLGRWVRYRVRRLPIGLGLSVVAGILSGLLGIGGGVVKVPAMTLGMGVPMKAATATSDFMIGVTAVASAFIYYAHGAVDVLITTPVALGVFFGSLVGARWAPRLATATLGKLIALVLAVAAVLMVLRSTGLY